MNAPLECHSPVMAKEHCMLCSLKPYLSQLSDPKKLLSFWHYNIAIHIYGYCIQICLLL